MNSDQWVIYDHPKDYPDNFVVRHWTIHLRIGNARLVPDQDCLLANSLEEARGLIPFGFVRTPPFLGDDPVIVEVWI
jgi:hypothetical protein